MQKQNAEKKIHKMDWKQLWIHKKTYQGWGHPSVSLYTNINTHVMFWVSNEHEEAYVCLFE